MKAIMACNFEPGNLIKHVKLNSLHLYLQDLFMNCYAQHAVQECCGEVKLLIMDTLGPASCDVTNIEIKMTVPLGITECV